MSCRRRQDRRKPGWIPAPAPAGLATACRATYGKQCREQRQRRRDGQSKTGRESIVIAGRKGKCRACRSPGIPMARAATAPRSTATTREAERDDLAVARDRLEHRSCGGRVRQHLADHHENIACRNQAAGDHDQRPKATGLPAGRRQAASTSRKIRRWAECRSATAREREGQRRQRHALRGAAELGNAMSPGCIGNQPRRHEHAGLGEGVGEQLQPSAGPGLARPHGLPARPGATSGNMKNRYPICATVE